MTAARSSLLHLLLLLLCVSACSKKEQKGPRQSERAAVATELDSSDLLAIAHFARTGYAGRESEAPRALGAPTHGVYVAVRGGGERLAEAWGHGEKAAIAMRSALHSAAASADTARADTLEIFLASQIEKIDGRRQRRRLHSNIRRGIYGLAIGEGERRALYSPTYVIASNRKNARLIELYAEQHGIEAEAVPSLPYQFLLGAQLLVPLDSEAPARLMQRGNEQIPIEAVTAESVARFAADMETWMWSNLHEDGRMTYLYYPSTGTEAKGRDNLIRQFMASIALGRVAKKRGDDALWQRAAQNIDYNLQRYYRLEAGNLGSVELRAKVKLGALALAALAIVEHKERARWSEQEAALRRSVQSLWHEDGSFSSFLKPAGRNDNQNFYPGEALLLWATLYAEDKDPELLEQFMKSFRYYRAWHLDTKEKNRRNPAFIPWHTQAYYAVYQVTGDSELRDFIFEMNDWLLEVQQWEDVDYPDTMGRFHDPERPFGPPHASSTGVYLEGLIDAYQLARASGESQRAEAYLRAIRRGLRSSMQLQFSDEVDMYYVSKKERVLGGLRTTVYDNQIRCDNVQHTLMGTLKILEYGALDQPVPTPAR